MRRTCTEIGRHVRSGKGQGGGVDSRSALGIGTSKIQTHHLVCGSFAITAEWKSKCSSVNTFRQALTTSGS